MKGCHWMQVFCSKIFPCEMSSPLSVSARSGRKRAKEKKLPNPPPKKGVAKHAKAPGSEEKKAPNLSNSKRLYEYFYSLSHIACSTRQL